MKHLTPSLPVVLSFLLFACGSEQLDGGSNTTVNGAQAAHYACDNRAIESTCADYQAGATKVDAEASCDGTVIESACSLEKAVGVCTVTATKGQLTNTYYSDGPEPRTEASARAECEGTFKGTFRTP